MQSNSMRRTTIARLVGCLLFCPVVLAACVLALRSFTSIYRTPFELAFYVGLASLPFVGVVGIVRFTSMSTWAKFLVSAVYLGPMALLVFISVVALGCSWAGACF